MLIFKGCRDNLLFGGQDQAARVQHGALFWLEGSLSIDKRHTLMIDKPNGDR